MDKKAELDALQKHYRALEATKDQNVLIIQDMRKVIDSMLYTMRKTAERYNALEAEIEKEQGAKNE